MAATFWETDSAFRIALDSLREYAVIGMDEQGMVRYFNPGAERMFGWRAEEVLGKSGFIIFTKEDRQKGAPMHEMIVAQAQTRAMDERWHVRKDGSRFWASGVMAEVKDDGGSASGYVKVLRDLEAWPPPEVGKERDPKDVPFPNEP